MKCSSLIIRERAMKNVFLLIEEEQDTTSLKCCLRMNNSRLDERISAFLLSCFMQVRVDRLNRLDSVKEDGHCNYQMTEVESKLYQFFLNLRAVNFKHCIMFLFNDSISHFVKLQTTS